MCSVLAVPCLPQRPSVCALLTSCEGHKLKFLCCFNQVNIPREAAEIEHWELAGKKRVGVESREREG